MCEVFSTTPAVRCSGPMDPKGFGVTLSVTRPCVRYSHRSKATRCATPPRPGMPHVNDIRCVDPERTTRRKTIPSYTLCELQPSHQSKATRCETLPGLLLVSYICPFDPQRHGVRPSFMTLCVSCMRPIDPKQHDRCLPLYALPPRLLLF